MRTKIYGALVTLGLIATVVAKAGHAEMLPSATPGLELVIDEALLPRDFHSTLKGERDSRRDIADVIAAEPADASRLNFTMASPGIFFDIPRNFIALSVRFSSLAELDSCCETGDRSNQLGMVRQ